MSHGVKNHPLDDALRARLHLSKTSRFRLTLVRVALHVVDALSRLMTRKPFFALQESENLLHQLKGVTGAELVDKILKRNGGTRIVPHGLSHIPATGPVIIASTHPTGMFDFVAHAGALLERRPDLKVVANVEVEEFLGPDYIVPVKIDKQNRAVSGRSTQTAMQDHLNGGGALLIFGSGRVPKRRNGKLVEPDWRNGTSRISESCGVPIVPAALDARNSSYYYRVRALAERLSGDDNIGAMVGSLRYSSELLEKLGGRFDVFYGDPLGPGTSAQELKTRAEALVPGLYA
ncbi:MAG: hypothetical protein GJ676_18975 [Rhodobacteraceae bacterium]|nr:hypothetical protein [Paracoccaceae bacterium]